MERQFKQAKLAIPARPRSATTAAERQSRALDEALLETFPASDPVSVVSD
jgi:hypothetical protein